ncbi:MAG: hypothetical protein R3281_02085, partial [Balneolaceae bacterium]|nr:hypothetical protein [Balneolaceae bacterium]
MNADGSDMRQLTDGEFSATSPAWSPNGKRIAFASTRQAPVGSTTLWVMEANGGNLQPLVRHPQTGRAMFGNHPPWSPDGTKIVFDYCINCERGGGNKEIFLADLQAGTLDTLTRHSASDRLPTWSPDGKRVAFISDRDYVNADTMKWRKDLYIVNPDGTSLKRLTDNGFIGLVSWHPQNDKIAFAANGLYMYNFPEQSVSRIKLDLSQEMQPKVRPIKWDIDGEQLLLSVTIENSKSAL